MLTLTFLRNRQMVVIDRSPDIKNTKLEMIRERLRMVMPRGLEGALFGSKFPVTLTPPSTRHESVRRLP